MSDILLSRDEAERLARVIIDDIKLYNSRYLHARGATSARDVCADAIDEGRAFFRQRVDSSFHDIYESSLAELEGAPRDTSIHDAQLVLIGSRVTARGARLG